MRLITLLVIIAAVALADAVESSWAIEVDCWRLGQAQRPVTSASAVKVQINLTLVSAWTTGSAPLPDGVMVGEHAGAPVAAGLVDGHLGAHLTRLRIFNASSAAVGDAGRSVSISISGGASTDERNVLRIEHVVVDALVNPASWFGPRPSELPLRGARLHLHGPQLSLGGLTVNGQLVDSAVTVSDRVHWLPTAPKTAQLATFSGGALRSHIAFDDVQLTATTPALHAVDLDTVITGKHGNFTDSSIAVRRLRSDAAPLLYALLQTEEVDGLGAGVLLRSNMSVLDSSIVMNRSAGGLALTSRLYPLRVSAWVRARVVVSNVTLISGSTLAPSLRFYVGHIGIFGFQVFESTLDIAGLCLSAPASSDVLSPVAYVGDPLVLVDFSTNAVRSVINIDAACHRRDGLWARYRSFATNPDWFDPGRFDGTAADATRLARTVWNLSASEFPTVSVKATVPRVNFTRVVPPNTNNSEAFDSSATRIEHAFAVFNVLGLSDVTLRGCLLHRVLGAVFYNTDTKRFAPGQFRFEHVFFGDVYTPTLFNAVTMSVVNCTIPVLATADASGEKRLGQITLARQMFQHLLFTVRGSFANATINFLGQPDDTHLQIESNRRAPGLSLQTHLDALHNFTLVVHNTAEWVGFVDVNMWLRSARLLSFSMSNSAIGVPWNVFGSDKVWRRIVHSGLKFSPFSSKPPCSAINSADIAGSPQCHIQFNMTNVSVAPSTPVSIVGAALVTLTDVRTSPTATGVYWSLRSVGIVNVSSSSLLGVYLAATAVGTVHASGSTIGRLETENYVAGVSTAGSTPSSVTVVGCLIDASSVPRWDRGGIAMHLSRFHDGDFVIDDTTVKGATRIVNEVYNVRVRVTRCTFHAPRGETTGSVGIISVIGEATNVTVDVCGSSARFNAFELLPDDPGAASPPPAIRGPFLAFVAIQLAFSVDVTITSVITSGLDCGSAPALSLGTTINAALVRAAPVFFASHLSVTIQGAHPAVTTACGATAVFVTAAATHTVLQVHSSSFSLGSASNETDSSGSLILAPNPVVGTAVGTGRRPTNLSVRLSGVQVLTGIRPQSPVAALCTVMVSVALRLGPGSSLSLDADQLRVTSSESVSAGAGAPTKFDVTGCRPGSVFHWPTPTYSTKNNNISVRVVNSTVLVPAMALSSATIEGFRHMMASTPFPLIGTRSDDFPSGGGHQRCAFIAANNTIGGPPWLVANWAWNALATTPTTAYSRFVPVSSVGPTSILPLSFVVLGCHLQQQPHTRAAQNRSRLPLPAVLVEAHRAEITLETCEGRGVASLSCNFVGATDLWWRACPADQLAFGPCGCQSAAIATADAVDVAGSHCLAQLRPHTATATRSLSDSVTFSNSPIGHAVQQRTATATGVGVRTGTRIAHVTQTRLIDGASEESYVSATVAPTPSVNSSIDLATHTRGIHPTRTVSEGVGQGASPNDAASATNRDAVTITAAQVRTVIAVAAFSGSDSAAAVADAQTLMLLGLSACGSGGASGLDETAQDGSESLFPLQLPVTGDAGSPTPSNPSDPSEAAAVLVREGTAGSVVLIVATLALQTLVALALRAAGRVPKRYRSSEGGAVDFTAALAFVRFPGLGYRVMGFLLPGLVFGAFGEVLGNGALPRSAVHTVVAVLGLVGVGSLGVSGLRVAIGNHRLGVASMNASSTREAGGRPPGNVPDATVGPTVTDSRPTGYDVPTVPIPYADAFSAWPTWAREWAAPASFWTKAPVRDAWGPAFAAVRDWRFIAVPSVLLLRGVLLGIVLAQPVFVGGCEGAAVVAGLIFVTSGVATLAFRPLRYRLLNVTSGASQLAVGALTVLVLQQDASSSIHTALHWLPLVALAATTAGAVLGFGYSVADRFKWRRMEKRRRGSGPAHDAREGEGTATALLQVPSRARAPRGSPALGSPIPSKPPRSTGSKDYEMTVVNPLTARGATPHRSTSNASGDAGPQRSPTGAQRRAHDNL